MDEALKVIISAETAKMRQEVEKAKKEVKDFSEGSEEASKAFDEAMDKARESAKTAMTGIAAACAAAVAALVGVAESTREFRTNQAKLSAAFETAGASAEVATKTYEELYRVLGDDDTATEAAQQLANITTNEKDLAQYTKICQGVFAKWGNSIESAGFAEAINHTIELGEVQGTLADALEWSGESVDEFNEELAKCTSTAEREQKVREKLNKLYAKSADNYEKNSKEILEANEAQLRLTKSLANIGKSVEPVITAFKDFGATLLEDAEEPIADICEWITDDMIPALKETIDWVKQNRDIIVPALSAITAGYVTYKAAVFASELASKGLTAATIAQTAAQTALNTIMNLNPFGVAAVALAALTAGAIAYVKEMDNWIERNSKLNEEQQILVDTINETAEALASQDEAYSKSTSGIESQTAHTTRLADELLRLADETGRVKEADEGRVKFILNELNNAYGTEYELVNGIITQYNTLKDTIYETIEAKKANLLLEANQAQYLEALQMEQEAADKVRQAHDELNAEKERIAEREKTRSAELIAAQQELDRAVEAGDAWGMFIAGRKIDRINGEIEAENNRVAKLEENYNTAIDNLQNYTGDVERYESAQAAILEGNYEEAVSILTGKSQAYRDYSGVVDEETKKALDVLRNEAITAGIKAEETKRNFENGVEGFTEEMVKEAEDEYATAISKFDSAYNDALGIGEDLGDGLKKGMDNKEGGLFSRAKNLVSGIITAMKNAADSHSPSKKTIALGSDMGEGTEIGITKSTKRVVKSATMLIDASLKPMEETISKYKANNLSGIFDTSVSISPLTSSNLKSINDNTSRLESLMSKYSSNGTPIILKVGEKVLAETTISSINQLTKETGDIPLLLMV